MPNLIFYLFTKNIGNPVWQIFIELDAIPTSTQKIAIGTFLSAVEVSPSRFHEKEVRFAQRKLYVSFGSRKKHSF